MGLKIKKHSALQTKLEDKGFQKSAINKVESMRPMKKGGMMMKKAQGGRSMKVVPISDSAFNAREKERKLFSGNPLFKKASAMKDTTTYKKSKSGGSFPDLNKDGKITKADILKGRGVIAKKGAKTSKKKMQYGGEAASMVPTMKKGGKAMYGKSMMNKGGKMKMGGKCKNGC